MKRTVLLLLGLVLTAALAPPFVQTNPLTLTIAYPAASVSPDLCFVVYSSNTLANPANWPVVSIISVTNDAISVTNTQTGAVTTYPWTNGLNAVFGLPIYPSNTVAFYNVAASNQIGLAAPFSGPPPELMPLTNIWSILLISTP